MGDRCIEVADSLSRLNGYGRLSRPPPERAAAQSHQSKRICGYSLYAPTDKG